MKNTQRLFISVFALLILAGCAGHSTITTDPLAPGEKVRMLSFSTETVIPVMTWRRGLTDRSNLGLHLGIPVYGTGIDYSYHLRQDERGRGDIINFGVFMTPNANVDFTYYKIGSLGKANRFHPIFGWRIMYIPSGIQGQQSVRFGFLTGLSVNDKLHIELGYFHDFYEGGSAWYKNTIIPTEKNPLTGLSIRFSLPMFHTQG